MSWLTIVHVDELAELRAVIRWAQILGVDTDTGLNLGETSVCAWAEVHNAVAIIDDDDARKVAKAAGLDVHGSLWVIASAVRENNLSEAAADSFIRSMVDSNMRYPKMPNGFCAWAKEKNLL